MSTDLNNENNGVIPNDLPEQDVEAALKAGKNIRTFSDNVDAKNSQQDNVAKIAAMTLVLTELGMDPAKYGDETLLYITKAFNDASEKKLPLLVALAELFNWATKHGKELATHPLIMASRSLGNKNTNDLVDTICSTFESLPPEKKQNLSSRLKDTEDQSRSTDRGDETVAFSSEEGVGGDGGRSR